MTHSERERIRKLLCDLGNTIQTHVVSRRSDTIVDNLSVVSGSTESDTIYAIDKFSEEALLQWFAEKWPEDLPVEVVAEGLEDRTLVTFPDGTPILDTRFKVIIDPIDGSRELMLDKRSAWVLAGVARQQFEKNRIKDIEVAMMTELPASKQRLADQISGCKDCGRSGLVSTRLDLDSGIRHAIQFKPSSSKSIDHGVAAFVKFFPEGKELMARFETDLWKNLGLYGEEKSPVIFDDQYISTGGQMYELISGHYRLFGDIRPEVLNSIGLGQSLCCHPYDVAAGLLLEEAGCVYASPWSKEVDAPMDTTTPVSWIAYANQDLADLVGPELLRLMSEYFPASQ